VKPSRGSRVIGRMEDRRYRPPTEEDRETLMMPTYEFLGPIMVLVLLSACAWMLYGEPRQADDRAVAAQYGKPLPATTRQDEPSSIRGLQGWDAVSVRKLRVHRVAPPIQIGSN
jgi:hypothetical protein